MRAIRKLVFRLRDSLFGIPIGLMLLLAMLAVVALVIDNTWEETLQDLPFLVTVTDNGGRTIVTTVAGATITVAAIVFSITALSTQVAASQYSPRVVSGFLEDPFQQSILGLVVGTFTYSLVVLGGLSDVLRPETTVRSLSVTLAIALGVGSVIGIVAYIDHSLRQMQIDEIVRRIADGAVAAVRRGAVRDAQGIGSLDEESTPQGEPATVEADRSGWVLDIDAGRIAAALPSGAVARVEVRVGKAVSVDDRLATIWPSPDDEATVGREVRASITTDRERSVRSDAAFGIRQLVDIALRALSPGVNDPTTAVDVIHHLKVPVREILQAEPPRRVFHGDDGQRVFLVEVASQSTHVHAAFSEIRLSADSQPHVLNALIEVIGDLIVQLEEEELGGRADALREEFGLTLATIRHGRLPEEDAARLLHAAEPYLRVLQEEDTRG